jgi:lipoate synthase
MYLSPQYLRPSRRHMRVHEYVPLEKYEHWRQEGEKMVKHYVILCYIILYYILVYYIIL